MKMNVSVYWMWKHLFLFVCLSFLVGFVLFAFVFIFFSGKKNLLSRKGTRNKGPFVQVPCYTSFQLSFSHFRMTNNKWSTAEFQKIYPGIWDWVVHAWCRDVVGCVECTATFCSTDILHNKYQSNFQFIH